MGHIRLGAKSADELLPILGLVHDARLKLRDVMVDPDSGAAVLRTIIPMLEQRQDVSSTKGCLRRWSAPMCLGQLRFQNVMRIDVQDTAGNGGGDVSEILWNAEKRTTLIVGDPAFAVLMQCTELSVEFSLDTANVVGEVRWRSVGDTEFDIHTMLFDDCRVCRPIGREPDVESKG